ncbi:MAG: hypothetical protein KGI84_08725, partial [Elusimicrobia bacterium]|nr:hypothetical protein [Elusimicrobiota bacterium]
MTRTCAAATALQILLRDCATRGGSFPPKSWRIAASAAPGATRSEAATDETLKIRRAVFKAAEIPEASSRPASHALERPGIPNGSESIDSTAGTAMGAGQRDGTSF